VTDHLHPDGLRCPRCGSTNVVCHGRPRGHECLACGFDGTTAQGRCPELVTVRGLQVRCSDTVGHDGDHRVYGNDYLAAERAARATGQLRHPASDTEETEG